MKKIIIKNENIANPKKIPESLKSFFKLRKRVFIDQCQWDVPNQDGMEIDQYDHEEATYCLIEMNGKVIAGARLMKTSCKKNGWSYMIRDAYEGRLHQIPRELVAAPPPQSDDIYEITRFVVEPDIPDLIKFKIMLTLASFVRDHLEELGAKQVLVLTRPSFVAWLCHKGMGGHRIGPIIGAQSERYCVVEGMLLRAIPDDQKVA